MTYGKPNGHLIHDVVTRKGQDRGPNTFRVQYPETARDAI